VSDAEASRGPYVTKTGKVLTDADVEALADEEARSWEEDMGVSSDAMHYRPDPAKAGPFSVVKFRQILGALSPEEQAEFERLDAQNTDAGQDRLTALWEKAKALHQARQSEPRTADNDLSVYAAEVGARMRARQDAGS
jgi:hypothetical protein